MNVHAQSLDDLLATVPIYCISLRDNVERRKNVTARVRTLIGNERASGIKFHIVDANNTSAVLGCMESHCDVIEDAMKLKHKYVMVLEDDVVLTSEFLPSIAKLPKNWDMIYLGYNVYNGYRYSKSLLKLIDAKTTHAYIISCRWFKEVSTRARQSGIPIDDYYARFVQTERNCYGVYPMIFSQADGYSTTEGRTTKYSKSMIARSVNCASSCSTNICREVVFLTPPTEKQWKNSTLIQLVKNYTKININAVNDYDYVIVHEKGCTYKHKKTAEDMEIIYKKLIKTSGWDVLVLSDVGLPKKVYAVRKLVWGVIDLWRNVKITYVYPPLYGVDENEIKNVEPKSVGAYPLHVKKPSIILNSFFLYKNIYVFATTNMELVKNITTLIKNIISKSGRDEVKNGVFFVCAPFDYTYRKTQYENVLLINHSIYNHIPPHDMVACDANCFLTMKITDYCKKLLYWSSEVKNTSASASATTFSDNIVSHIGSRISSVIKFKVVDNTDSNDSSNTQEPKRTLIEIPKHNYRTVFKPLNSNRTRTEVVVWDNTFLIENVDFLETCDVEVKNGTVGSNFAEVIVCKSSDLTDAIYWHCMNSQYVLFVTDTEKSPRKHCLNDIKELIALVNNRKMLDIYRIELCKYAKKHSWQNMVKSWDNLL